MKNRFKKHYVLYGILSASIFFCGCGNNGSPASSNKVNEIKQEETAYVAQPILLPEYDSFDGAYSDGNDLYYAAYKLDQTSFYTLKKGEAEPEMNFSIAENQRVLQMTRDEEGNTYFLGYEETPQEEADEQTFLLPILYKLDTKGTPMLELDLSEYIKEQEQVMIMDVEVDKEGHMVIYTSSQKVYVLNPDGSLLFDVRTDGAVYDICRGGEKVFVAHGGSEGMEIREIDISGKKLSSKMIVNIPGKGFRIAPCGDKSLLISTDSSVYKYDVGTGEIFKKFDWSTYDSIGISAGMLLPFGENGIMAISRNYGSFPMMVEVTAFREALEGEEAVPEKVVLTIGVDRKPTMTISKEIVEFNKKNPNYRIEVKNYEEDYTMLHTEIMTGNGPDILALRSYRIAPLAEKGVLEDLNPYIDADAALDRQDFLENILTAFETEGHLYGVPFNFRIDALAGKASLLEGKTSWNLEEMLDFAENFPEGTEIFTNTSKSGILRLLKCGYTDQLVDMDNTEHPLNREMLTKMLEFANRYEEDDKYVYDGFLDSRAADGQLQLVDTYIFSGTAYRTCSESIFGEPASFIGYPTLEGNGNLIICEWSFAMNNNSKYKDVAWEFISLLMSEEVQLKYDKDNKLDAFGFPIRKDALEVLFENNEKWVYNDYLMLKDDNAYKRDRFDLAAEEVLVPVRDLIQSVDTVFKASPEIDAIIEEEAAVYFSGVKPVEEVVDIIENRIRTYVNEMK